LKDGAVFMEVVANRRKRMTILLEILEIVLSVFEFIVLGIICVKIVWWLLGKALG
jgi:hypothetical protein